MYFCGAEYFVVIADKPDNESWHERAIRSRPLQPHNNLDRLKTGH